MPALLHLAAPGENHGFFLPESTHLAFFLFFLLS